MNIKLKSVSLHLFSDAVSNSLHEVQSDSIISET